MNHTRAGCAVSCRLRRLAVALAVAVAPGLLASCEGLLDVTLPTRVPAEALENPSMARTLVLGAVNDFECAFSQYIHATGLWAGEFINSAGWAEVREWGAREPNADSGSGGCADTPVRGGHSVYLPLHIARKQAETAYAIIDGFEASALADRELMLARLAAYAGYGYTLLGEAFCEVRVDGGPIVAPAEALRLAEDRFSKALTHAQAAGDAELANMARVGRARVRLNLGRGGEAVTDARAVTSNFVVNATYSTTTQRRWNNVYRNNNHNRVISVHPRFRGLEVDGVPDPRVPARDMRRFGDDAVTALWVQEKYSAATAPIPVATWEEAQLIIAEGAGGAEAVAAINRLRAKAKLPAFSSTSASEIRAQVMEERRRQLFLQGHRLGDMLRLRLPFDTGINHKGVPFSTQTCIPLPLRERLGLS